MPFTSTWEVVYCSPIERIWPSLLQTTKEAGDAAEVHFSVKPDAPVSTSIEVTCGSAVFWGNKCS